MVATARDLVVRLGTDLRRLTFFPLGPEAQALFNTKSVQPANHRYTVFFNADNNQQTSSTVPTKGVQPLNVPRGTK